MMPQQYCLRWKYHHSNLQNMFSQLLDRGCFCDVTLACEGQTLKAHRVVLCACSTYFDSILTNCSTEKDPIIIMRDCKFADIKSLIEFMYKGEINVEHNNLASLLKTAEELRIKGLAEVSWRDEEGNDEIEKRYRKIPSNQLHHNSSTPKNHITATVTNNNEDRGQQHKQHNNRSPHSIMLGAPMCSPVSRTPTENGSPVPPPPKKKRGRPPLDGEFDSYSTPKIAHVECGNQPFQLNDSSSLVSVLLDETSQPHQQLHDEDDEEAEDEEEVSNSNSRGASGGAGSSSWHENNMEMQMDCEEELSATRLPKLERPDTPPDCILPDDEEDDDDQDDDKGNLSNSYLLTPQEQEEWKDVIKMNDYLTKGRRPQFWEEPFTKRVMEAIKTKDLEMKKAAQLMGVSYGTLYGRYRETYGCLKHPYR